MATDNDEDRYAQWAAEDAEQRRREAEEFDQSRREDDEQQRWAALEAARRDEDDRRYYDRLAAAEHRYLFDNPRADQRRQAVTGHVWPRESGGPVADPPMTAPAALSHPGVGRRWGYATGPFIGHVIASAVVVALWAWLAAFVVAAIYRRLPAHPGWPTPYVDPAWTALWSLLATLVAAAVLGLAASLMGPAAGLFGGWLAGIGIAALVAVTLLQTSHLQTTLGPVVVYSTTAVVAAKLLAVTHRQSR